MPATDDEKMLDADGPTAISRGAVVVGVNGALAGCRQALVFAAHEASLRNAVIRLVHGCQPLATLTERQPEVPLVARERQARRQLRDAAEALRPLLNPGTMVEFRIDPRTGVDALLEESTTAALIVLQRRDLASLGQITAGSTSSAVATRAHCPVAVTRAGLGSSYLRSGVLVGVDGRVGLDAAVQVAFGEAAVRRARLTAMHVLPQGDPVEGSSSASTLAGVLDRHATSFPEVDLTQLVIAGGPVEALRDATASAQLLVIGRHSGRPGDQRPLGSVARQLINTAQCPTLVAPPMRASASSGRNRRWPGR